MVFQPLPSIPADVGFIEQLLGGIPNRLECGLSGSVGRIIFLTDNALYFCELDLERLVSGKDFLDFVIARLRDSG
ncbi:hypothetical protein EHH44_06085 [Mycolicibacter terrae]|uniref:Uncharacterized protein n=1 Tax=Mycolicibacter terrae TaxID=1788 RepID=A0ACD2EQE8_9MYCO|nr:hypothetical protein [Mycolicibacter terrae]RRR47152.1 hypothetical protein EHH44_06085 [Mycolicibacter terrae]